MSYEDFLAAWKKLNESKTGAGAGFQIESIRFTGRTINQRAELEAVATVRLLSDGPAEISLGLVGAILQGEPQFDSQATTKNDLTAGSTKAINTAQEFLDYDPNHGGFIAHVVGAAGERRTIKLALLVPVMHDGAEITLPINCPRAISSDLSLTIDAAIREVRASTGAVLSQELSPEGGTVVKVAGPSGLFRLSWQTASKENGGPSSLLSAIGAVRVAIDGRGVRSDARLTVRSYGGTFDQFRVRLPIDAQLVQARPDATTSQEAKYRIRVEPDASNDPGGGAPNREVAIIELPEKQQGPVTINLTTEQPIATEGRGPELNLGGFEVVGAIRQFGDVALNVADDWQARWTLGSTVRQVDPTQLDASLQTARPTAAFQYDRQPWMLAVRVTRRELRVHVTPKFELECLPDETRLTMRLAYQVFGAPAFEFKVDLNGWEMTGDPVESGGLVNQDGIVVRREQGSSATTNVEGPNLAEVGKSSEKDVLVLPLTQASSRRAEVAVTLRLPVDIEASRLELPLPIPIADSVGTGELSVHAAPDLELLPDLSTSAGLSAAVAPATAGVSPAEERNELHFRTLLPGPVIVMDRSRRARDVKVQSTVEVDVMQDAAQVDQRLDYIARYEPIAELIFDVPVELGLVTDQLELFLLPSASDDEPGKSGQGTPLDATLIEESADAQTETRPLRIALPRSRIGPFAVRIRYRHIRSNVNAESSWMVPLFQPRDGQLTSNQAVVRTSRNLTASLDSTSSETTWKSVAAPVDGENAGTENKLSAAAPERFLPLVVRTGRPDQSAAIIIDRVWIQTWLSSSIAQNRAAFHFRTTSSQATVELPPNAVNGELDILVDREPAEVLSRGVGRVTVRIPPRTRMDDEPVNSNDTQHTLELRFRQPYRHHLLTRHYLTPPQLEGSNALSHVYWHLVLPSDEHVVHSPAQLAVASQWQWLGSFWGRRPLMSQVDLENWSGASEQPAPTNAQCEYLFTGLLPVSTIELITAPRWLIVLAISGMVLILAIAWLNIPASRRSWVLVAAAFAIGALAIVFPTMAFLLAQAAVIGLVVALIAALLAGILGRPGRPSAAPIASPSSQRVATPRAESIFGSPVLSGASTAPTASLRLADAEQ